MSLDIVDQLISLGRTTENGEYLVAISCLGSKVAALVPDMTFLDALVPLLPPTCEPISIDLVQQSPIEWTWADPTSRSADDRAGVIDYLASQIEYAVAEWSEKYVFVHAGVVVVDQQALVFPGESHAGKSTLIAALVKEGATYFSDEYAVVDSSGMILPFARRIALRNSLFFPEGKTDLTTYSTTGNLHCSGHIVRAIYFTRYAPNSHWVINHLDRTSALIELCKNTAGFTKRPDMSFAHLGCMLDGATAYAGTRGEAAEAVHEILKN